MGRRPDRSRHWPERAETARDRKAAPPRRRAELFEPSGAEYSLVRNRRRRFFKKRLRLVVNREKSAVDRPWKRKFLGYTFTVHYQPKFKVAPESVKRFKGRLRGMFRQGRGRSLRRLLADLRPVLRGWVSYYRKSEVRITFQQLDEWLRRKLRVVLWRQWKRNWTRAKELLRRGLTHERAWTSATNGRGSWWNAGASHMHQAVPTRVLSQLGLVSLVQESQRLTR